MSKVFKCNKCGKEFSYDSPALENWAATRAKPEQIKCPDCFGSSSNKSSNKSTTKSQTSAVSNPPYRKTASDTTGSVNNEKSNKMSAELFKRKYDELCAVFCDDLDDVKEYLGGWTTSLVLDEVKPNILKR